MSPFDIEDEALPAFLRIVAAALAALRGRASVDELERAIRDGDTDEAIALVDADTLGQDLLSQLWPRYLAVMRESYLTAGDDTPPEALEQIAEAERQTGNTVAIRFDLVSPYVLDALERAASNEIEGIAAETRAAIQDAITRAYTNGESPRIAAKEIRDLVGLNRRQAEALDRYRSELETAGASPARVDTLTERYAKKLVKQRAEMIARTETSRAMNDGRTAQWKDAVAKGLLDPARWEREWRAVLDSDRTCPECLESHGTRAPIDGVFPNGEDNPPLHPMCRCLTVLVRVE